ncbi:transcriptional regulator [Polyrhizophydium stewartii]|uniref:Transcriptional regulator n=1 Tax=Polyrhizophydium stewartii TaxID=2732419 RepID=A0ABR4NDM2_9FUNG
MSSSSSPAFGASTSQTANAAHASQSAADRFGLLGLIDVIRMTSEDLTMLALGCDLPSLGLNLNSSEPIYSSFLSPFSELPSVGGDPIFSLPACYSSLATAPPLPPALSKIPAFSEETLFYIFYSMPRDAMQEAAAQELYNRSWRFHKELRLWLTKDPANSELISKSATYEHGIFVFFDPSTWSRVKKEWMLYYDQLEERAPASNLSDPALQGRFSQQDGAVRSEESAGADESAGIPGTAATAFGGAAHSSMASTNGTHTLLHALTGLSLGASGGNGGSTGGSSTPHVGSGRSAPAPPVGLNGLGSFNSMGGAGAIGLGMGIGLTSGSATGATGVSLKPGAPAVFGIGMAPTPSASGVWGNSAGYSSSDR